ncbi:hypothetical protein [Streptomyces erythrochromogenes]|uniref:hypothetical protein n=1 Tax=Streptomyces erythrochromogenes TaxID=285574 RepID=UPI0004CCCFF9|nr:hypothetical protein [Streptomyces erythrochromogenes]
MAQTSPESNRSPPAKRPRVGARCQTILSIGTYTKEYGARSAPRRAGMPVYELFLASLPEFCGGLGAALALTRRLDRRWKVRRDRRRAQDLAE